jgi:hypothetical protein
MRYLCFLQSLKDAQHSHLKKKKTEHGRCNKIKHITANAHAYSTIINGFVWAKKPLMLNTI